MINKLHVQSLSYQRVSTELSNLCIAKVSSTSASKFFICNSAHRRGIHRPRGRRYHGDSDRGDRTKAAGSGLDGGRGFQRGHPGAGGKEGGEYSDGPGNGGSRRYGAAFHAAKETVVSGRTDVGHEATGTGGAVLD